MTLSLTCAIICDVSHDVENFAVLCCISYILGYPHVENQKRYTLKGFTISIEDKKESLIFLKHGRVEVRAKVLG